MAKSVRSNLKDWLGIDAPDSFERSFLWLGQRLGHESVEDLGAWLILECAQMRRVGREVGDKALIRALNRVQKRLIRQHRREAPWPGLDTLPLAQTTDPPLVAVETQETMDRVAQFIERLSPEDALLLAMLVDRHPVKQIATDLGWSIRTAYRRVRTLRMAIGSILPGPQPETDP